MNMTLLTAIATPLNRPLLPPRSSDRFGVSPQAPVIKGEYVRINDGRQLHLRPIASSDVAAMQRCFTRLSPEVVRRRFLHPMSELPDAMAQRLCRMDPAIEAAWVLMDETTEPAEMRGVGRIYVDKATDSAEFSVLVEQDWTHHGLGALLMQQLVDECRRRHLSEIWGFVLMENRPMLNLCMELGFRQRLIPDEPGTELISLQL